MKVLIINSVYKEGSTGKIVDCLADSLRREGHSTLCCYGNGKKFYDDHSVKICTKVEHYFNAICGRIRGIQHGGLYFSNCRFKKIVETFRPDVVHVHCVNGSIINVYSMLKLLAKKRINTVITLHAEIFHTAGCEHAFECNKWKEGCNKCIAYKNKVGSWFFDRSKTSYHKMKEAIYSFYNENLTITAVSPWIADRARQSTIMKNNKVVYVPNGVDTSIFYIRDSLGLINKNEYEKIIIFVTPYLSKEYDDNKGGRFLFTIAEALPNYKFVIVAGREMGAIGSLPTNVQLWGKAKSQNELAQLYSEADMTLLLSRRESFSMVTAESLCCGTPVIGFKAGGPESIALPDYSIFVDYGDIASIINTLSNARKQCDKHLVSLKAREAYSKSSMTQRYLEVYNHLCYKSKLEELQK